MTDHLTLDPAIRDWVVLPLMIMAGLITFIRHFLTIATKQDQVVDVDEREMKQLLVRAKRLRTNGKHINSEAYASRKACFAFFVAKDTGKLRQEDLPAPKNPMADPSAMMGPMKSQMGFMVTQFGMMAITSYLFDGFAILKVPFPLTNRFKVMLQRGVEVTTLDPSYVSSTSFYFLVSFGMRSLLQLFLTENEQLESETKAMQAQMGMGGGQQMGFDASKVFPQEADSMELVKHHWVCADVEKRLLGHRYPVANVAAVPGMDYFSKDKKH
ncbi:unnamed protein product [Chrysoparadoxa australica]